MPTAAQLAVAAVVAASHVHCSSKGSFDAFSGTVLFAVFLGMHALPAGGPAKRWSGNLSESAGTVRYSHVVTTVDRGKHGIMYRSINFGLHWTLESHLRGCGAELGSFGPKTGPANFAPGLSGAQHGSAEDYHQLGIFSNPITER
jgi:hypothetical protein